MFQKVYLVGLGQQCSKGTKGKKREDSGLAHGWHHDQDARGGARPGTSPHVEHVPTRLQSVLSSLPKPVAMFSLHLIESNSNICHPCSFLSPDLLSPEPLGAPAQWRHCFCLDIAKIYGLRLEGRAVGSMSSSMPHPSFLPPWETSSGPRALNPFSKLYDFKSLYCPSSFPQIIYQYTTLSSL